MGAHPRQRPLLHPATTDLSLQSNPGSAKLQTAMGMNYLVAILIFVISWALLFPQDTLAIVAELKRQLRLRLVRRCATASAKELTRALRKYAAEKGIDPRLVEDVLTQHQDLIVERLGSKQAEEILGEVDPTERYH